MREVTHGDIRAAARVLLARPETDWPMVMGQMLTEAHHADCYRKALGRYHPRLGNGTLMGVAFAKGPVAEPNAADGRYLAAIGAAIDALIYWRAR